MTRILGVDPGSQATGYGLVEVSDGAPRCLDCNIIRPGRTKRLPDRLLAIHDGLAAVIAEHLPDVVAVETAFYHKSARSTLVLGHVHGVVLLSARQAGLPVDEYAPRDVKVAVTGSGNATKEQVAFMVRGILGLAEAEPSSLDASDALAVALCHWHRSQARVAP